MKTNNINYLQSHIKNIVFSAVENMAKSASTTENDLSAELVRSFGQSCKIDNNGNFSNSGDFSPTLAIEWKMLLSNYFGNTDLLLFDNSAGITNDAIGFELKIFGNHYPTGHWKNVEYFFTGTPDNDVNDTDYDKGKSKKNGHRTHCQEGQLLKDYIKAVKIINQNNSNVPNLFYLVGIVINDHNVLKSLPQSQVVEDNIEKLILPYSENKHYKCFRSKTGYYSNITEQATTKETVKVLQGIVNTSLTYFPYVIEIEL